MAIVLEAKKLTMQFGGLKAVSDLDLSVPKKTIFGLIGPNGAGKTTVFNMLTGVYQPTHGEISAFGQSLVGLKTHEVVRIGLARTFQNIRLFKAMTVLENLLVALDNDPKGKDFGIFSVLVQGARFLENEFDLRKKAKELLTVFRLEKRANEIASSLPYGDQRRLEIARAMATGARFLLLDEPAAGMNANETASLMNTIREVRSRFEVTVLLIEHDMKLVMGVCERIAVLDYGVKIAEGNPDEIRKNPKVIEAYLGKAATAHG